MTDDGQRLLATSFGSGAVAAPGSSATIMLWSSSANISVATQGARWKRFVIFNYVSHISAVNGLQVDASVDNTNWRNIVSMLKPKGWPLCGICGNNTASLGDATG